jgi:hypothetical protein
MFKTSTENARPGFAMTFNNGWTISVQWHEGAYCEGKYSADKTSANAEIAIWNQSGNWFDFGDNQVKGYCTAEEVLEWMNKTANM